MRLRIFIAVLALGVTGACSTPSFTMPPGPPEYRLGYADGCDAGYAYAGSPLASAGENAGPPPKDDPQRVGWLAGYERCKRSYQRMQGVFSAFFGPP